MIFLILSYFKPHFLFVCNETYFCFGSYHVRFLYISVFANIEIIEIEIRHGKDINKNRQHDIFFCVFLKKNDLTYIISDLYVGNYSAVGARRIVKPQIRLELH